MSALKLDVFRFRNPSARVQEQQSWKRVINGTSIAGGGDENTPHDHLEPKQNAFSQLRLRQRCARLHASLVFAL